MPPRPASDPRWIGPFRERYAAWWPEARPLIEGHDYAAAFKTYPWPVFTETPWTPVRRTLAASRVALVTTGGLYRPGIDAPFEAGAPDGDPSVRRLPRGTTAAEIALAHDHFSHEVAETDLNTIYPVERLEELRAAGEIGDLAPTHYSLMGYVTNAAELAEHSAPAIAAGMREEGVDVALVVPV